ncbi:MAG: ribonuclease HII [Flavobacteriales bacterium]|nr:ribonuclease HII [Flavobacteriales bacterium]MCC6936788.1 ribonuclease HII [Flavobacteriales bacterium]
MALAAYHLKNFIEAGCDEAGRGCLAGPVVAAAVILPARVRLPGLDDSKQLNEARRDALRPLIEARAIAWAVAIVDPLEIDAINILNASFAAMHRAVDALRIRPEHLLIDGNRFNVYAGIPHSCHIRGDGRFRSIAAASILAKTHRDELMQHLHCEFPVYGWAVNKGYPTLDHRSAIQQHGPCIHHRKSFRLLKEPVAVS